MTAYLSRLYGGREVAILVAVSLTVMAAILMWVAPFWSTTLTPSAIVFAVIVASIFVGFPALLGITLVMIPVHEKLVRYGTLPAALGVVLSNCILVLALFVGGVLTWNGNKLLWPESIFYLGFAGIAAVIWLASDRLFRSAVND